MFPWLIRRVFLVEQRVDFRRRFDGLHAHARALGANPYHGDCVVFLKRDKTQLRALLGDALGLYLVCRRFDAGRLQVNFKFANEPTCRHITTAELAMLFEGAYFTVHSRAKKWDKEDAKGRKNCFRWKRWWRRRKRCMTDWRRRKK